MEERIWPSAKKGRPGDEKEAGKIAELGSGKHLNSLRISPS
jgi:hypothetical protein